MKRQRLVRFQIFLLFVAMGLVVARVLMGPPTPQGLIVFTRLEPGRLEHAGFVLDGRASLFVEATGSFENLESSSPLAAYAWILRRDTREVVWQMTPTTVTHGQGTLAHIRDSLSLPAGTYDVFFTTYGTSPQAREGASFLSLRHHWTSDADRWRLVLQPGQAVTPSIARPLLQERDEDLAPHGAHITWSSAPARRAQHTDVFLFQTRHPIELTLYAVGELCEVDAARTRTPCDFGWLENATSDRRLWEMTWDNTEPAGGSEANRYFRGRLTLPPGLYRAGFTTNDRHHPGRWHANPPLDPAAWGLTLYASDPAAVTRFDPWTLRTPLVSLTRVPSDALRSAQFVVEEPVRLIAYALGEISSGGSRYDYAWVENNESGERLWEMTREASQPVGDEDSGNRVEIAFLNLSPGTYTVGFQTDGSHAFGDWRKAEPPHAERWGVTLFPLPEQLPPGVFRVIDTESAGITAAPLPEAPPPPPGTGRVLLRRTRLGNDARVEFPFTLARPTRLRITALGEISTSGTYDYGWIEQADNGETVWKMTLQNTRPAGGDDRNRRFDGVLTLPPGEYVAYFKTDFSHAYGDFDDGAPDDPAAWGIVIELLDE
ncbi:hypothetical protein GQ464_007080 [Rhodocaloribacter litoris]|uniref:hypothetical protein n=1 Tax=Rhodocaloribacter litoris TaxID=2558931 RepID=UPI0014234887|nr:hypothetical protein [Rhodocaloribacter litoris]QXD16695.1 hypothetical protein GQ464_007080 [Rhodocaloribacter litoris]